MSRFTELIIVILTAQIPEKLWLFMVIFMSSILGGIVYAHSGSWLQAIGMDLMCMFFTWVFAAFATKLTPYLVRFVAFILP
jgi:hypothetical protein